MGELKLKEIKYTDSHEWATLEGEIATCGISSHAQKELGEIVWVELPKIGSFVKAGQEVAVLESTKAACDIYSPLSGTIVEVNTALNTAPEKINLSPMDEGWIFKLKVQDIQEFLSLK